MSFVNEDDVMDIQEGFLKRVFKEVQFMLRISKYFNMLVEDVFHVED